VRLQRPAELLTFSAELLRVSVPAMLQLAVATLLRDQLVIFACLLAEVLNAVPVLPSLPGSDPLVEMSHFLLALVLAVREDLLLSQAEHLTSKPLAVSPWRPLLRPPHLAVFMLAAGPLLLQEMLWSRPEIPEIVLARFLSLSAALPFRMDLPLMWEADCLSPARVLVGMYLSLLVMALRAEMWLCGAVSALLSGAEISILRHPQELSRPALSLFPLARLSPEMLETLFWMQAALLVSRVLQDRHSLEVAILHLLLVEVFLFLEARALRKRADPSTFSLRLPSLRADPSCFLLAAHALASLAKSPLLLVLLMSVLLVASVCMLAEALVLVVSSRCLRAKVALVVMSLCLLELLLLETEEMLLFWEVSALPWVHRQAVPSLAVSRLSVALDLLLCRPVLLVFLPDRLLSAQVTLRAPQVPWISLLADLSTLLAVTFPLQLEEGWLADRSPSLREVVPLVATSFSQAVIVTMALQELWNW
jgi:hypothetical protein